MKSGEELERREDKARRRAGRKEGVDCSGNRQALERGRVCTPQSSQQDDCVVYTVTRFQLLLLLPSLSPL